MVMDDLLDETLPVGDATSAGVAPPFAVARLQQAWAKVAANDGAAGVDGVSVAAYGANDEGRLKDLATRLQAGAWRPSALRAVVIPKPDGGQRTLSIPTVEDRVVHQVVALELGARWEPRFSNSSYGYRPGRSAHAAVELAIAHLQAGFEQVLDLDLVAFFDNLDIERLKRVVFAEQGGEFLRGLLGLILGSGCSEVAGKGIAQGSPLSPLLANIYLHDLDVQLEAWGVRFVRYADDFLVFCADRAGAEATAEKLRRFLREELLLEVKEAKSASGEPEQCGFLGFGFRQQQPNGWRGRVGEEAKAAFGEHIAAIARRGGGFNAAAKGVEAYVKSWLVYYQLGLTGQETASLLASARRELRTAAWREWATPARRRQELIRRGLSSDRAFRLAGLADAAKAAVSPELGEALPNRMFKAYGLWQETPGAKETTPAAQVSPLPTAGHEAPSSRVFVHQGVDKAAGAPTPSPTLSFTIQLPPVPHYRIRLEFTPDFTSVGQDGRSPGREAAWRRS